MPNDNLKRKITIGCDPEMFLTDVKSGRFVSAHDKMPGTKEKPHPVDYGAIQVDGVAAEFNIEPCTDAGLFASKCGYVMKSLQTQVGEGNKLTISPTALFDQKYWDSLPDNIKKLGCNPDFNGWTGEVNPSPDSRGMMRTASGHVHLGWGKKKSAEDQDHYGDCCLLAKQMDYYLGIFSLVWDADTKRRSLYGKAGTFRPKEYGIEYRTLSNRWLSNTYLMKFVFNQSFNCVTRLLNGMNFLEDTYGELAREVLDNSIPWFNDPKHKLWQVTSMVDVDMASLLQYKDPAWSKDKDTEVKNDNPKILPKKANYYKKLV